MKPKATRIAAGSRSVSARSLAGGLVSLHGAYRSAKCSGSSGTRRTISRSPEHGQISHASVPASSRPVSLSSQNDSQSLSLHRLPPVNSRRLYGYPGTLSKQPGLVFAVSHRHQYLSAKPPSRRLGDHEKSQKGMNFSIAFNPVRPDVSKPEHLVQFRIDHDNMSPC